MSRTFTTFEPRVRSWIEPLGLEPLDVGVPAGQQLDEFVHVLDRACACSSSGVAGARISSSRSTDSVGSISRFLRSSTSVRTIA